jgi:hypothetical protein
MPHIKIKKMHISHIEVRDISYNHPTPIQHTLMHGCWVSWNLLYINDYSKNVSVTY